MAKKKSKSKKATKQNRQQKVDKSFVYFHYILTALAAILIFYPPYFRGLFFDGEMLLSQAFIFFVFLIFIIYRLLRGGRILSSPLDYVLAILCVIYGISLAGAVVPREAWLGFMAVCAYFAVFLMVSRLSHGGNYRWFIYALVLGAVGVSLVGIGVGFGSFDFPGAERGQRIFSTLQYPNTTAALLTAGFFAAISRIEGESNSLIKGLLSGAGFLIFVTFVFTMSRAAWLLFPLVLVIYWLINGRKFVSTFIYSVIPLGIFLPVAMLIWEAIQESEPSGWYYLFGGVFVSVVVTFVFAYFFSGIERIQKKAIQYVVVGVLVLVVFSGSYYAVTNYEAFLDMMPGAVESRIERIDFEERGFTTRVELMETAWEITTDRPLIGAGGGGWESLYHQYMDRDYWTTEVHSHIFQVGVETGIPGMIAFMGIWVALAYQFVYLIIKKKGEGKDYAQASGLFVGAIALGGHSMVDFNLSLGAVAIYLWAMLGLVNFFYLKERDGEESLLVEDNSDKDKKSKQSSGLNKYFPYLAGALAFGMIIYSLVIYQGFNAGRRAEAFAREGMIEEAVSSYETAVSNDHLNAEFHYDLMSTYEEIYNQTGEERFLARAVEAGERALELDLYYPPHLRRYGQFMLRVGNIDEGLKHLEKSYKYHLHGDSGFKAYASGLVSAGKHYISEGQWEDSRAHLEDVIELREEFLEYHSEDSDFDLNVLKVYVYLEEYEMALDFMESEEVFLPGGEMESELFKALTYQGNGKEEKAEEIIDGFEGEGEDASEEVDEKEELREEFEEHKELLGI